MTTTGSLADRIAVDGYAFLPGVLTGADCDALGAAIEMCRAAPGPTYRVLSPPGEPRLESELFRWRDTPAFHALAAEGALPAIACEAFGTDRVILMEDQWFLSEAGAGARSPWHQDHPYHPLEPWFLTIWLALDDPPGEVGLEVARASHGGRLYGPVEFSATDPTLGDDRPGLAPVPDIDGAPRDWSVVRPPVKRGDAIAMDSRTLHAAGGYCRAPFRRLSLRYAHPETRFTPRNWAVADFWEGYPFEADATIADADFPLVGPGAVD